MLISAISIDTRENPHSQEINDPVKENVLRVKAIRSSLDRYDLISLIENTQLIYRDGISYMSSQVKGKDEIPLFTAVVVELNKITGDDSIQHEKEALIATIKAHRIMTELMWIKLWKEEELTRQTTRDEIIAITTQLKRSIFSKAKEAALLYEVESLEQAAKCLDPGGGLWSPFFTPTITALGAAASSSFDNLFSSIYTISTIIDKEWIDEWYVNMFPLIWISTSITTLEVFESTISPHFNIILDKGNMYSVALVNILKNIFENPATSHDLKEEVFSKLIELVSIKPSYTLHEAFDHPEQIIDKVLNRPDRYTQTRSFAAMTLCDLGVQPENERYRTRIAVTLRDWSERIKAKTTKKYHDEQQEIEKRLKQIGGEIDRLTIQKDQLHASSLKGIRPSCLGHESSDEMNELENQLEAMNLEQSELETELNRISHNISTQGRTDEDEELQLLEELSAIIKSW